MTDWLVLYARDSTKVVGYTIRKARASRFQCLKPTDRQTLLFTRGLLLPVEIGLQLALLLRNPLIFPCKSFPDLHNGPALLLANHFDLKTIFIRLYTSVEIS